MTFQGLGMAQGALGCLEPGVFGLSQHQKVPPEISETCRTVLPRLALKNAPMSLVVVLRCLSPVGHPDGFFLPGQSYGFRA